MDEPEKHNSSQLLTTNDYSSFCVHDERLLYSPYLKNADNNWKDYSTLVVPPEAAGQHICKLTDVGVVSAITQKLLLVN